MSEVLENAKPQRTCIVCGDDLLPDGTCGNCGSSQEKDFCETCRKAMPAGAKHCNACNSYKKWRRHLPIVSAIASMSGGSVLVASAVVSVFLFFYKSCSDTHFRVGRSETASVGAEAPIYVKVWNTGREPSTLVGYHLLFDNVCGKETTLALTPSDSTEAKNVIASGAPVVIKLTTPPRDQLPKSLRDIQYQKSDVEPLDWQHTHPMTLIIDVQESYNHPGRHHPLKDQFLSERIASFIASNFHLSLEVKNEKK